jgi:predicted Rossmann fold nucleotide-binding protein DprA/Smf involved in DNA uptake
LVEQLIQLKESKGTRRLLETTGRHSEVTPPKLTLDFVPNAKLERYKDAGVWVRPRHYVRVKARQAATPATTGGTSGGAKLLEALRRGPSTATQLMTQTGISRTQLDRRLKALKAQGRVRREGDGSRKHPFKWSLVKKQAVQP